MSRSIPRHGFKALAALFFMGFLAAACSEPSPPPDLTGSYGADIPALGTYSRRVHLSLESGGAASLTMTTPEGQLHSLRDGHWEFKHGKVVVTLFTKSLLSSAEAAKTRQPDETLSFAAERGVLRAVDYDRTRWSNADITLTREANTSPAENPD